MFNSYGRVISAIQDSDNQDSIFTGEFYCAIGLIYNELITKEVQEDNLLVYPYNARLDFISPEDIPTGSLVEATLRWAFATNNLKWAFHINCFHDNYFQSMLTETMKEHGFELTQDFFKNLKNQMLKYYTHPTRKMFLRLPNEESAIKIYKECYFMTYHDNAMSDKFAVILKSILLDRTAQYRNNLQSPSLKP